MSPPTKAYNIETKTPQTNHSINESLREHIHSPILVGKKGQPPFKGLNLVYEMAPKRKNTIHANRTSSSNNDIVAIEVTTETTIQKTKIKIIEIFRKRSCHHSLLLKTMEKQKKR